jgi:hypothetical protein
MTPPALARLIVETVQPSGVLLEPCAGAGAFVRAMQPYGTVLTCEAATGDDFSWWSQSVDWVITNPPWSNFRRFLLRSLDIADHVVFLATINHWWTKRRVADVADRDFGYHQLLLLDWPAEFPASGFQLGAMHLARHYHGPLMIRDLRHP